jgi:hypothetical protein
MIRSVVVGLGLVGGEQGIKQATTKLRGRVEELRASRTIL